MANLLGLLGDGWREIGRIAQRLTLGQRLVAIDRSRRQALTRLGQTAWQAKVDLSELAALRGQLEQIDARAGSLSVRVAQLDAERADLQVRREAEANRFDALLAPAKAAQSQADTALRAARAALTQPSATEPAAKAALANDVDARTAESQRCAAEVSRLEAERTAALRPFDTELERLRQVSGAAAHDNAAVGRHRDERFFDLGTALYERSCADPPLAECVQVVTAIDADRARVQAQLDGSLALTRAMASGTMAKFSMVVLLAPVLLVAAGYVVRGRLAPSEPVSTRGPAATGTATKAAPANTAGTSVSDDERRKDDTVQAYLNARSDIARRLAGVEVLKADVIALGSAADRSSLPLLLTVLERGEPELRAAAANAIGMIGPTAAEAPAIIKALNDPMPAVRGAVLPVLARVPDASARLLAQRVLSASRDGERPQLRAFEPTVAPDAARLGTPVYPGATFLAFASDLEIGRVSFSSADPVQKVIDHFAAAAGRPPIGGPEFTRLYLGGTASDASGSNIRSEELQTWYRQAAVANMPAEDMQAELARRVRRIMSPPMLRYADGALYGEPVFIATAVAEAAGKSQIVRYVVVFQDHSLGRTGFEYYIAADAARK
jgi:hypothetical protein